MPTASHLTRLQELGLVKAAKKLANSLSLAEKCRIAYTQYRFITPEKVEAFQSQLKKVKKGNAYKKLLFTALEEYSEIPPEHVLDALELAKESQCFDTYEIASVQWIEPVPDPLLLGRITGCEDYFFIAQWDDDVKIEDILQADEGYVKPGMTT